MEVHCCSRENFKNPNIRAAFVKMRNKLPSISLKYIDHHAFLVISFLKRVCIVILKEF